MPEGGPTSTSAATAPRRRSFATSDPLEARAMIEEVYGSRLRVKGRKRDPWELHISEIAAGRISVSEARLPSDLAFRVDAGKEVVIETVLGGTVEIEDGGRTERYLPGDVFVAIRPDARLDSRANQLYADTVAIPTGLLLEVAGRSDEPSTLGELLGSAADAAGARRWKRVTGFIGRLLADPGLGDAPLFLGQAERLLAAAALSCIGTRPVAEPGAGERSDARPETLRRAIAFIEANPAGDISMAEVASAASATSRAVQMAFRRHLDTTPMAYLRKVRLDHAHRELVAASPGDGVTVARVSSDWGFAKPGRFAGHYRAAYGCPPSETLAH